MIKELKTLHSSEPACQRRSDGDHLRFVISRKREELQFDFTIELNGAKTWVVPEVPSMNPLDRRQAEEGELEMEKIPGLDSEQSLDEQINWDKGNYIPIDDNGNALSESEALQCLHQGALKFFLQGKKLVGEFVLLRRENHNWLLMKRHDEFALYHQCGYELQEG